MTQRRKFEFTFGPARSVGIAVEGNQVAWRVRGVVQVTFNSSTEANVQTHHDTVDSAPLMVGESGPYWINLTIRRQADGEWTLETHKDGYFSRPGVDHRPMPLTHRSAITAAAEITVADLATPHVLAEADYANALRDASRIVDNLEKVEAEAARLRKALRPLVKIIDAFENPGA